jgi:hypothetical protein
VAALGALGPHRVEQLDDHLPAVPDDRARRPAGSWRSRRVDVACTTLAFGAKLDSTPVDPVVEPRAQGDQHVGDFCIAATAATVPCIPGMPMCCGWLSGNAPGPSAW